MEEDGKGPRTKYSTFFADSWSHARIEAAIGRVFEAYQRRRTSLPSTGVCTDVVDGVTIEVRFRLNPATQEYEVRTAFPANPQ